jgi:hypothetical protein
LAEPRRYRSMTNGSRASAHSLAEAKGPLLEPNAAGHVVWVDSRQWACGLTVQVTTSGDSSADDPLTRLIPREDMKPVCAFVTR